MTFFILVDVCKHWICTHTHTQHIHTHTHKYKHTIALCWWNFIICPIIYTQFTRHLLKNGDVSTIRSTIHTNNLKMRFTTTQWQHLYFSTITATPRPKPVTSTILLLYMSQRATDSQLGGMYSACSNKLQRTPWYWQITLVRHLHLCCKTTWSEAGFFKKIFCICTLCCPNGNFPMGNSGCFP